jgi:tetratricopeptide (TPR) repeat protein
MMSVVPVTQFSEIERVERRLALAMGAVPRDPAAAIAALQEAIELARVRPEAAEWFVPAELLGELADEYEAAGRIDEALSAMQAAIDAGWSGHPEGRCRLAGILIHAGRLSEAEQLFAAVGADRPDDLWLHHTAAVEYATLGDHQTSLRWSTDGLRLALRVGDPYDLAESLLELRAQSLDELGRASDDLQDRAENYVHSSLRAPHALLGPGAEPDMMTPGYHTPGRGLSSLRWSWFPATDYARALRLWPELTADGGPAARGCDHATYCRRLQSRLRDAAGALMTGLAIAPIRIDGYLAWCQSVGEDPANARARYAAALPADQVIAWPPGRNDACWCGSTRKYKRCCGQPPPDPSASRR